MEYRRASKKVKKEKPTVSSPAYRINHAAAIHYARGKWDITRSTFLYISDCSSIQHLGTKNDRQKHLFKREVLLEYLSGHPHVDIKKLQDPVVLKEPRMRGGNAFYQEKCFWNICQAIRMSILKSCKIHLWLLNLTGHYFDISCHN